MTDGGNAAAARMRGSARNVAAALAALIAVCVLAGAYTYRAEAGVADGVGLTFVIATGILLLLFHAIRREMAVSARKDAEIRELAAALTRRASEVEAVTKELEAFAYSVSHDLRAPLRHINGYVELLSTAIGSQLGDEPRRYLGVIATASQQMGELIDDLLAFSRMTRADMHNMPIDLRATVDAAIAGLEIPVRGRNIDWHIGVLPVVEGDPSMVKAVYANLIDNAVKYTAPRDPARIEIGAAGEEDGRAVLFVRDNGVGFDMKYAGKLFGIFQRMHHPDDFEGTGIGLATAQRIVTRHGGRIWAESVPGEGTTFYFTLQPAISEQQAAR